MIPYTTERRADTGVTNVTMGIWLFLASEVMLFGAFFSAYALLRVSATEWPSGRQLLGSGLAVANTLVLIVLTTQMWSAARGPAASVRRRLSAASVLALLFLILKGAEWAGEISHGLAPSTNMFLALYFTLTGLHAAHVAGGLAANLWILKGSRSPGALTAGRAKAAALYWTFVDVVWFVILGLFYV
jgi:cytochrome c oxidase subunit III